MIPDRRIRDGLGVLKGGAHDDLCLLRLHGQTNPPLTNGDQLRKEPGMSAAELAETPPNGTALGLRWLDGKLIPAARAPFRCENGQESRGGGGGVARAFCLELMLSFSPRILGLLVPRCRPCLALKSRFENSADLRLVNKRKVGPDGPSTLGLTFFLRCF